MWILDGITHEERLGCDKRYGVGMLRCDIARLSWVLFSEGKTWPMTRMRSSGLLARTGCTDSQRSPCVVPYTVMQIEKERG